MNTPQADIVGSGPSRISQNLAHLDELVDKLNAVALGLVEKIDPALLPVPSDKNQGSDPKSVAGSPVSIRLVIASDRIETVINLLCEVTQRVEL